MRDRADAGNPTPRSLGWTVAARTAVAFVLIGVAIHIVVQRVVVDHFHDALVFHAEFVVDMIIEPAMWSPTASEAALATMLRDLVRLDDQVVRLDLLDHDGVTTASSMPTAMEPSYAMATTMTDVPAGRDHTVRVVQDRAPSDAAASAFVRRLDVLLVGGLLTTWLLVVPLVSRLGRRLQDDNKQLEAQGVELRRLLDQEHESVARLEELSTMKDGFLGAVSHELRTPMAIVAGVLETLRERGDKLPAALREDLLDRGLRSARKLDVLVSSLLDLNRLDGHGPASSQQLVELQPLVTEVAAHLPPCRLIVDLGVAAIVADRLQMERVLSNLIGNAIRHAHGTEAVEVRSVEVADGVEITVSDRGPGVPDELKQAIFEPFRQGPLRDAHSPGTGIGLSLVARFVAGHGGCTWVSDRPGGGATFHVRVPSSTPDANTCGRNMDEVGAVAGVSRT